MDELERYLDDIDSKEAFLMFVSMLRNNWEESQRREKVSPSSPYGPAVLGWENVTIGRFLDAMHAWADGSGEKIPDEPSWKMFAEILYAGKFYE